ncbi:unnamed protein product [Adineta ricciae]|uniref:F-box domain-containing protein n=1 Tax=Adineta ricciae TaxID=249248 RepID=A0A814QIB2_ADIRI|nr:unnamed protein product [Adineta ricciae]
MSSAQSITVLESLPDEVLLAILSYLHAIDRLRTFNKLNSRFDGCLREVGGGIDDNLASDEPLVRKFAPRTIFIRCYERNEELDLNQFPALRSLTLADGVWPQVVTINPEELPVIQHISLRSKNVRVDGWHLANRIRNVKVMPGYWQHTSLCFLTLHLDHPFKKRHFKWLINRLPVLMHLDVDSRHDEHNSHRVWTYNTELMETFSEVARTQNADNYICISFE